MLCYVYERHVDMVDYIQCFYKFYNGMVDYIVCFYMFYKGLFHVLGSSKDTGVLV